MKLGRNDSCHCGSGRKYKHCHYDEDRAAEAKALRDAAEAAARDAEQASAEDAENAPSERPDKRSGRHDGGARFGRGSSPAGSAKSGGNSPKTAPRTTRGAQRGG